MDREDQPLPYTVTISETVEQDIGGIYLSLMGTTSLSFADRWRVGRLRALDGLSMFPQRFEVAPESSAFHQEVRRLLYRQGRVVYRVLCVILDADGVEDTVRVLRVVHAARFNQ